MDSRRTIAPIAITFLVLSPVIVGVASESSTPKPAAATLTIEATASDSYVRLLGDSAPPTGSVSYLVDASGETTVEVTSIERDPDNETKWLEDSCAAAPEHDTGKRPKADDGEEPTRPVESCLRLGGVDEATSVTGTLAETGVTLTVNRPMPFLGLPLLLVGIGIAIAVLLLWLAGVVKNLARATVLADLITDNEAASSAKKVIGLRAWVEHYRSTHGDDVDAVASLVHVIVSTVPARAQHAREVAGKAAERLSDEYELRRLLEEASKGQTLIDQYCGSDGEAVKPPALVLSGLVDPIVEATDSLDKLEKGLKGLDADTKKDALEKIERAMQVARWVTSSGALDELNQAMAQARNATSDALQTAAIEGDAATAMRASETGAALTLTEVEESLVATPKSVAKATAIGLWVFYLAMLLVVAILAIYVANYAPKPAFGSDDDLLALGVAALGSASAGTIAAAVGWWKVEQTTV